jgi:acyl-CoA reductase-like NAD-dependent aldehyde dehydrogenase
MTHAALPRAAAHSASPHAAEHAPSAPELPPVRDYIEDAWETPGIALGPSVCDANDARALAPQRATEPARLDAALAAAARAFETGAWSEMPAEARAEALEKVATLAEARAEAMGLADARTTGAVITVTRLLASVVPHAFREAARQLRAGITLTRLPGKHGEVEVHFLPWGPAAVIAPWNSPSVIGAHKIANALAAGCPVVLKPSEWAPHSCGLIAEAIAAAGLPKGTFQMVHGAAAVGGALVADARIRAVSITGGVASGRAVARACAETFKPAQLELGGNNPLVVLEDADIGRTAAGVVSLLTTLNGQWCRALGRLIVPERLATPLLDAVLALLAELRLGSSLAEESQMGPLIHEEHRARVERAVGQLVAKGGVARASTKLPDLPGFFFAPTLVTGCAPEATLEEIFGPVAAVHTYPSESEALALANQTPYGLAGYVFGGDERRALAFARKVRAGGVKVNGAGLMGLHPSAPRGAWGLSGMGDEGAFETLRFFCGSRVVGVV